MHLNNIHELVIIINYNNFGLLKHARYVLREYNPFIYNNYLHKTLFSVQ